MADDRLTGWLTADKAATRLGVKTATLYAYVSRGVLLRRRSPDGHSRFDPAEVDRLARRGRPRRRAGVSEVTIESRVTALGADRPYFRGHDALALAVEHPLEDVAELLWTGELRTSESAWVAPAEATALARAAQTGLPAEVLPIERLQIAVPILATLDPLRHNRDPETIATIGRALVPALVECLPLVGRDPADGTGIAARLWSRITGRPADAELLGVLGTALSLLADHELAASTLAARVAASVRADPYAVVLAGFGAMGGSLHGGASLAVESLLAEIDDPANAGRIIGQRQRRGERIPGFGHAVYQDGDGRATTLLAVLRRAAGKAAAGETARETAGALELADAVLAEAGRRGLPAPNIDLALGTFSRATGMITGGGEAIFAIARTVGWLAHAIEEYEHPTRLRLRAHYTG
jgi:citrate synthase